jgi:hypothetical protein
MSQRERDHQIANELGIAMGMVQLALMKIQKADLQTEAGQVCGYLEKAGVALARLKLLTEEARRSDPEEKKS